MFESKIINDITGTYMIILSEDNVLPSYEMKMFEYNEIKGFLPIMASRVNNNIEYHYRIMDYENITKIFCSKTFDIAEIKNLFQAITMIGQRAAEFLLNPDSVILNPEYIYLRKNEYLFCYYPGKTQSFHKGVRELMEYILERLDHSNQENVMVAYGVYQKVLKNNFTMEMLMEEFFKNEEEASGQSVIRSDFTTVVAGDDTKNWDDKQAKEMVAHVSGMSDIDELEAQLSDNVVSMSKKKGKEKEKVHEKVAKKSREKFSLQSFFEGKIFFSTKKSDYSKTSDKKLVIAEKAPYGSTQLLTGKCLYNQSGGEDIMLVNFPIEIGNAVPGTAGGIDNQAVSRHHAVLTLECGMYYVEDLGSTNGTFVNGSRISPYEPVQIKEGDVVAFANERYSLN